MCGFKKQELRLDNQRLCIEIMKKVGVLSGRNLEWSRHWYSVLKREENKMEILVTNLNILWTHLLPTQLELNFDNLILANVSSFLLSLFRLKSKNLQRKIRELVTAIPIPQSVGAFHFLPRTPRAVPSTNYNALSNASKARKPKIFKQQQSRASENETAQESFANRKVSIIHLFHWSLREDSRTFYKILKARAWNGKQEFVWESQKF